MNLTSFQDSADILRCAQKPLPWCQVVTLVILPFVLRIRTQVLVHELLHWQVLLGEYQGSIYSVESVYERNKCSGPSFEE
jgi:hypothetical protein